MKNIVKYIKKYYFTDVEFLAVTVVLIIIRKRLKCLLTIGQNVRWNDKKAEFSKIKFRQLQVPCFIYCRLFKGTKFMSLTEDQV